MQSVWSWLGYPAPAPSSAPPAPDVSDVLDDLPASPRGAVRVPPSPGRLVLAPAPPAANPREGAAWGHPAAPHTPRAERVLARPTTPLAYATRSLADAAPAPPPAAPPAAPPRAPRHQRLLRLLAAERVPMDELRKECWNGVPPELRALAWQLLLGYAPLARARRAAALEAKRAQYWETALPLMRRSERDLPEYEAATFHQITIDIPRMAPGIDFFADERLRKRLFRILYVWAQRHPASGYVQGVNDLLMPFFIAFLRPHLHCTDADIAHALTCDHPSRIVSCEIGALEINSAALMDDVEADCYGCFSLMVDSIQDSYLPDQPGVQRQLERLGELLAVLDAPLARHLRERHVHLVEFAFRWMNCLLVRELPLPAVMRLWDTYLSEDSFASIHVFVCAAFLLYFSAELLQKDYQETLQFLHRLPTAEWREEDLDTILSQAFVWMTLYNDAPKHLAAAALAQSGEN